MKPVVTTDDIQNALFFLGRVTTTGETEATVYLTLIQKFKALIEKPKEEPQTVDVEEVKKKD